MHDMLDEFNSSRDLELSLYEKASKIATIPSLLGKRPFRSQKWNIRLGKGKRPRIFYSEEEFFLYYYDHPDFKWLHELHYPSSYALIKYYYRIENVEQENFPFI